MPTVCNITFPNNLDNVFYGGQLLLGHVELSLTNSKNVRGFYVDITGSADCRWSEGSGKSKRNYTGNESYLNERTYLIGRNGEITLQPGNYNYDFQCNLPLGLPTSLKAEYGYIRYMVSVVLDRSMWPDKKYERIFTVIKPLNLNLDPALKLPRAARTDKTIFPFCLFCCCPSKRMHIVVRIPVGGYTSGQTINVDIEVDNRSAKKTNFSVLLLKHMTFHNFAGSSKQKAEHRVICGRKNIGHIGANSSQSYRASLFIPPPIMPTDEDNSNICKVRYILRVTGPISGCHGEAKVEIPVTIGTLSILDDPSAPNSEEYNFTASTETGPIVLQPTHRFNEQSAAGAEPTDPLLPDNGSASYPPSYSSAAPPYPGAGNAPQYQMQTLPSAASSAFNPSAPYPESDPPTYERATKGGEGR